MGATLPPGMLESPSRRGAGGGQPSHGGSSRRPTLLLLGLDLPASVRGGIREALDRGAPGLFGGHVVGADALPSLASVPQTAAVGRGFFAPCGGVGAQATAPPISLPTSPHGETGSTSRGGTKEDAPTPETAVSPGRGEEGRDERNSGRGGAAEGASENGADAARTRASLVQAALSAGKNVSLEVVPGPGLWARGRFLRDLEALLVGLDDCDGDGGEGDTSTRERARKRSGPTVLLIDGHIANRSGGGTDLSHGTKFMEEAAPRRGCGVDKPGFERRVSLRPRCALAAGSLAARRVKSLMEDAAQCLHDLSTAYGKTPSPFKAIQATKYAAATPHASRTDAGKLDTGLEAEARRMANLPPFGRTAPTRGQPNASLAKEGSPGMELLLAACHMILHPDRRYDVGEGRAGSIRTKSSTKNAAKAYATERSCDAETDNAATLIYASCLAHACRKTLAENSSAQGVAGTLRGAALDAIPLETAAAVRRLIRHPDWPPVSPRPDFADCGASEAFTGWVYAAVAGATELALEGGGGSLEVCSGRRNMPGNGSTLDGWTENQGLGGGVLKTRPAMECGGSDSLLSLKGVCVERRREQEVLREMEAALIDENVTVLDDDSPWVSAPESNNGDGDVQDRRQCRTSEVLSALMETALRSFNVSCYFGNDCVSTLLLHFLGAKRPRVLSQVPVYRGCSRACARGKEQRCCGGWMRALFAPPNAVVLLFRRCTCRALGHS